MREHKKLNIYQNHHVTEKLNPYGTILFGGWWERLRGITKNCIQRAHMDNKTLNTIMTEVERLLSDRTLTNVSSDQMRTTNPLLRHIYYIENGPRRYRITALKTVVYNQEPKTLRMNQ